MTLLVQHADQVVRHAVDAYLDGRLRSTFEGEASFETRNSRYCLLDGVLWQAPDSSLLGAELVGWLIEYVARSEVSPTWKPGARAVLVDPRNDGVKGPHIVVTSATRGLRFERPASAPALRASAAARPQTSGSSRPQGGSTMDQPWDVRAERPIVPAPRPSPSWGLYPEEPAYTVPAPTAFPPPPALPSPTAGYGMHAESPRHAPLPPLSMPQLRPLTVPPPAMMAMKPATMPPPPPPPRLLPRAVAPQMAMYPDPTAHRLPPQPSSLPLSRSHQRGLPLR